MPTAFACAYPSNTHASTSTKRYRPDFATDCLLLTPGKLFYKLHMTTPLPSPSLLLDASTPTIHVGILNDGTWQTLEREQGDAMSIIPRLLEKVLHNTGLKVADLRGLIHCEGPGALLGLRIAAMSIETWRAIPTLEITPLFTYRSLHAAAALLRLRGKSNFHVATPFRRGSYSVCPANGQDILLLDDSELSAQASELYFIEQRHIKNVPTGAKRLDYDLTELPAAIASSPDLLRTAAHAEAFSPQLSEYKLWSGERHRSPDLAAQH